MKKLLLLLVLALSLVSCDNGSDSLTAECMTEALVIDLSSVKSSNKGAKSGPFACTVNVNMQQYQNSQNIVLDADGGTVCISSYNMNSNVTLTVLNGNLKINTSNIGGTILVPDGDIKFNGSTNFNSGTYVECNNLMVRGSAVFNCGTEFWVNSHDISGSIAWNCPIQAVVFVSQVLSTNSINYKVEIVPCDFIGTTRDGKRYDPAQ